MLQAAFNPLVPKAQYSGGQNVLFPLQVSQAKLADFYFLHLRH